MSGDPYQAPGSDPTAPAPARDCPDCRLPMERGYMNMQTFWHREGSSWWERFRSGGTKRIAGPSQQSFKITLRPQKTLAFHCHHCGITIVMPQT